MSESSAVFQYNDEQKHKILIVDDSIVIQKMVNHILEEHNYDTTMVSDGSEALELLKDEKIDLIVTDINMPQIGGFALVEKLHELNLDIPYVMITDADINKYLNLAIEHNVGNILSKPIEKSELLTTVYKLLYPETLFGLKNYLNVDESELVKLDVASSQECENGVLKIVDYAKDLLDGDLLSSFRLILSEMSINALYHPHGLSNEKEERVEVTLNDGDKIQLQYGANSEKLGVSITDFEGNLTRLRILQSFKTFIENNENMMKAIESGEDPSGFLLDKGRGLQMAREMANEYYFNIKSNEITEIVILTWLKKLPVAHASQSIKINEIS